MMILIKKILYSLFWNFVKIWWIFVPKKMGSNQTNKKYSIAIATYVSRYERFFIPLIKHLSAIFPDTEIVVGINGYYDQALQKDYLSKIEPFLKTYRNIKFVSFAEPQSLSKIWNLMVINTTNPKTLILNDDVEISPDFRNEIEKSGILNEDIALMNKSWSHYLISKIIIKKVGWFDERYPELGNEDEDYESRMALKDLEVKSFKIRSLYNYVFQSKDFSYGKDIELVNVKYAKANKIFFDSKWDTINKPANGYKFVRILNKYVKLKEGMETPDFYRDFTL